MLHSVSRPHLVRRFAQRRVESAGKLYNLLSKILYMLQVGGSSSKASLSVGDIRIEEYFSPRFLPPCPCCYYDRRMRGNSPPGWGDRLLDTASSKRAIQSLLTIEQCYFFPASLTWLVASFSVKERLGGRVEAHKPAREGAALKCPRDGGQRESNYHYSK